MAAKAREYITARRGLDIARPHLGVPDSKGLMPSSSSGRGPTYAWSGKKTDPKNMRASATHRQVREVRHRRVVIDHLLSRPASTAMPGSSLSSLAYAAALTSKVDIATGILVLPVRHPVLLAKEISTLCHLSDNRYVFGVGPGWYAREYEVTGSRIQERGKRTDEIIEAVTLLLTKPNASYHGNLPLRRRHHRPPAQDAEDLVSGVAACRSGEHDVRSSRPRHGPHRQAGNWLRAARARRTG